MKQLNYEGYGKYLQNKGYSCKLVTLDQDDINHICKNIKISGFNRDYDVLSIMIEFLDESKVVILDNHLFKLYISDENGIEIPDDTKVIIQQIEPSGNIYQLSPRIHYSDIKNGYKFNTPIIIHNWYHFCVYVVKQTINIPKENIKFEMTFDYWTKV